MLVALGYVLIVVGLLMVVLGVLAWLGIIDTSAERKASVWDFLIELLKRAPWVVVAGLILIYFGARMAGASLPP
jgi:hypothetical protein